jgi:cyanophycinase
VSIHLIGGGWRPEVEGDVLGGFLSEAAVRAAGSGRMVPRLGVLLVVPANGDAGDHGPAEFATAFERVASSQPVVTTIVEGDVFESSVLSDIDGLVVGGGLTPAYLAAVQPLIDEIRLLVGDVCLTSASPPVR